MNLFQFLHPIVKPPKDVFFERYLNKLTAVFGSNPEFWYPTKQHPKENLVVVMIYREVPAPGFITGVTYGLSLDKHPDWILERPELCIVVKSQNENWTKALGHLVSRLRGACPFITGQIIRFGTSIVEEATMDAFLVAPPLYLEEEEGFFNIEKEYGIRLQALYPLRESEISSCETWGLDAFLKHPQFDAFDVSRPSIDLHSR